MTVEENGEARIQFTRSMKELPDILDIICPRVDVSAGTRRSAVPAVIEAMDLESARYEVSDNIRVTPGVFSDSMNERHESA